MTPRRAVEMLITDLDDTLYDWVSLWHASFSAMLEVLVKDSGLTRETLEADFKSVFTRRGTSEYAFAIQELPSLLAKFNGEDLVAKFDAAIHAYRSARKSTLKLFPTVRETLATVKAAGCLIVGYTESPAFYTGQRLKALGLDGVLDYLYSPPDHELPAEAEELRHYPPSSYELHRTVHRHTEKGVLKPSPKILLGIIAQLGGDVATAAYVGDKLAKDVGMARDAGVLDLHATYAVPLESEAYQLLRRVSHWTPAAVEKERLTTSRDITPTIAIATFGDILDHVAPQRFVPPRPVGDTAIPQVLEAWKTSVAVQQHFNDIELRIRNFGLTIVLATLGAAGWSIKERLELALWGWSIPVAAVALSAGCLGWLLCYVMDRHWYHRLLQGAVGHSGYIEKRMRVALPELALSGAIGRASPFQWLGLTISSNTRVNAFYLAIAVPLLLSTIVLACSGTKHARVEPTAQPTTAPPAKPAQGPPASQLPPILRPATIPTPTPSQQASRSPTRP